MRIELVRCEVCKSAHDALYMFPTSWFVLKQGDERYRRLGDPLEQHFCSKKCLAEWASKDREFVE